MILKKIGLFILFLMCYLGVSAQLDASLLLGLTHATTTEINAMSNPIEGTLVYNSTSGSMMIYNGNNWVNAVDLPADLLDGDDDTMYTAGNGLILTGTSFSVNNSIIAPEWSNITDIPTNLDASNTNEIQVLSKSGNTISLNNGGGSVTETVTGMKQDDSTGIIFHSNEEGTIAEADVISRDTNNALKVGSDGGAFFESNVSANTIKVDQSFVWAGNVNDPDIHENGTLTVNQTRSDTGWSFANPSTLRYEGTPDHVKINLMAVANNTGNHWAHPHIKIFRNGIEIGEGSGLYMDDSTTYSGRTTTVISMIDPLPGTNPVYTFTTLEDDNRTMNNPTIPNLSPVSLVVIEKVDVVVSITN